jgi:intraflagellar transport protein 172
MQLDSLNTNQYFYEWSKLREVLYNLVNNIGKSPDRDSQDHKTFQKLFLIAHYNTMRCSCVGNDQLDIIATKLSISLLRHCDLIPGDKAFYEAGRMCQKVKWDNMAFVFLNRYIDLADAIDDGTGEVMDNSYLTDTDIPVDVNLPEVKFLSDEQHEEIKTWVISVSMNGKISPSLNTDERGCYEAMLNPPDSDYSYLPCVITGKAIFFENILFFYYFKKENSFNFFII